MCTRVSMRAGRASRRPHSEPGRGRLPGWMSVVLLASLWLAWGGNAAAQRAVEVSPPVRLHQGVAGGAVDAAFAVTNPTDATIRARVYLADWHYQGDGAPEYLEAGSLPRSLEPHVTFNPSELLLAPGETSEVRYTVSLPSDVDAGSYWGVLFIEAEDPEPEPGFELARFNVRVGHVVYVDVPPLERDGMITGIFGAPPGDPEGAYTLAIQYVNSGNAVQKLDGYVELRDASGAVLFHEGLPSVVSLPGDMVGRTFDVYGPLEPGTYSALVVYDYGDEAAQVAADHTFTLTQALREPGAAGAATAEVGASNAPASAENDRTRSAGEGP